MTEGEDKTETLRRLEHEAATGTCAMCGQPSVGFISSWDNHPKGICAEHAEGATSSGYTVHPDPDSRPPFNPFALEDDCDADD